VSKRARDWSAVAGSSSAASLEQLLRNERARGVHTRVVGLLRDGSRTVAALSPTTATTADRHTLFEIGSVTKVFTTTLLAEMHLRGDVHLSDAISQHVAPTDLPSWRYRVPTLEELATHRSALPNTPRQMFPRESLTALGLRSADPWHGVTEQDYRGMLRAMRPRRAPGGRVRYSSVGFGLLGDAEARRANASFDDVLRRRVCSPLGLVDTCVEVEREKRPRLLEGHFWRGAPSPPLRDWMPAAGDLRSSVADLLSFLQACLEPPSGVIGEALALAQQERVRVNWRLSIGLGWLILRRRRRPPVIWHGGGTWGFRSFVAFVPDEACAVAVLSNSAREVNSLGFKLIDQRL
jgi:D-alanyl-D-alanine-carboxypeptidase/D-alanyl-D-alanine-endopeptidase